MIFPFRRSNGFQLPLCTTSQWKLTHSFNPATHIHYHSLCSYYAEDMQTNKMQKPVSAVLFSWRSAVISIIRTQCLAPLEWLGKEYGKKLLTGLPNTSPCRSSHLCGILSTGAWARSTDLLLRIKCTKSGRISFPRSNYKRLWFPSSLPCQALLTQKVAILWAALWGKPMWQECEDSFQYSTRNWTFQPPCQWFGKQILP